MSTAVRFMSIRFLFLAGSLLSLALLLAAAPAQAAPGQTETESSRPHLSASQRALSYDHRTAPKNVNLIGRFNAADHPPARLMVRRQPPPPPKLFLDLEREVDVEVDVWYGKAGVQIDW